MQEAANQVGIESTFKIMNVIGGRLSLVVGRTYCFFMATTPHERRFVFEEGSP